MLCASSLPAMLTLAVCIAPADVQHISLAVCRYPYVCHAEMNAVLNKNTASLSGAVRCPILPC